MFLVQILMFLVQHLMFLAQSWAVLLQIPVREWGTVLKEKPLQMTKRPQDSQISRPSSFTGQLRRNSNPVDVLFPTGRAGKLRILIETLFVALGIFFDVPLYLIENEAVEILFADAIF